METKDKVKVQVLSAKQIIDNARERYSGVEEHLNGKAQLVEEHHVLIEEADN